MGVETLTGAGTPQSCGQRSKAPPRIFPACCASAASVARARPIGRVTASLSSGISTSVEDNCRGILSVLEKGRIGEVYNIGGLDLEENLTLVRRILKLTGQSESLVSYVQDRPGHDRRYALNCRKIETELDWHPAISLEDGLRRTIDWYKSNLQWVAGVRSREYLSYYEKYYENRETSLRAIARSG